MPRKLIQKSEDDVQEMLVYLDIDFTLLSEDQIKNAEVMKVVGNEKKLLLQVNDCYFEGNYDYSIGTHVFFEKDESISVDPLYSQCDVLYKYKEKTAKIVKMNRVQLRESSNNDEKEEEVEEKNSENDESTLSLTRTYQEALNLFLQPGKSSPRKISPEEDISEDLFVLPSTVKKVKKEKQ